MCGLWHLGCVTAACISPYHPTVGWDPDRALVERLRAGEPPVSEPGMTEALREQSARGNLHFTDDVRDAAANADVLWCTFDTPVDEHDVADTEFVLGTLESLLAYLKDDALVIVSSQLPIGSTARLQATSARLRPNAPLRFAYVPENLRLGSALQIFRHPDRVVAGVDGERTREQIEALYRPLGDIRIEWMSPASAEMSKHAINAFLAMSLSFINEIAALCERTGADVRDVERALRSESRIGPRAYVSAGPGYAGGTLARDILYLQAAAERERTEHSVIGAVNASNLVHREWTGRTLRAALGGDVAGKTIAVWGLTYKPRTDTLRRSTAVELCVDLANAGARVAAFDPAVRELPPELAGKIQLAPDAVAACAGADALAICTEWPEFLDVPAASALAALREPVVVDAKRFMEANLRAKSRYYGIGIPV